MNYGKDENQKKQKKLDSKKKKIENKINISFLRFFILAILLVGIVGVGAAFGAVKGIIDSAPDIDQVIVAPEGYSSVIYDQNGNEIVRLVGEHANRIYVEIDMIPSHLQNAFVAIEDERFWSHSGIDLKGIMRAVFVNLKDGNLSEGASTITQQLLKNNVLDNAKNFERKIQEQYLAVELEKRMDKEQILEYYLNTIGLGQGTLGVQAASHRYFNKDVWDLTLGESAVIAAITQRPTYYDPTRNPENNRDRQKVVLGKMLELGYINQNEYEEALDEEVYLSIQSANEEYSNNSSSYSYFVDEVIRNVVEDLKTQKGYSESQAYNLVYRGGLSIYATQDLNIQKAMDDVLTNEDYYPAKNVDYGVTLRYRLSIEKADQSVKHYSENSLEVFFRENNSRFNLLFKNEEDAENHVNQYRDSVLEEGDKILGETINYIPQPQASMVIIDYHTGHVKALTGGRGEKQGSLTLNRATSTTRQPGSTFKVLASFLPAIDTAGFTLASVQDDVPYTYPNGKSVKNWYDTSRYTYNFKGLSSIRQGIAYSMNIVAVKTLEDIGPKLGYDYLMNLGFTTVYDEITVNGQKFSDIGLPLALGGITKGVTNLELTAAYGAIANNGVYMEPIFYTRVLDHDGTLLIDKNPITRTVMKETTSFLLTNAMEDTMKSGIGTAPEARFRNTSMPIAGKTGTTTSNHDIWFSGYTPYYVASVWMGYDINNTMVYDRGYHKIMWRDVMEKVHENLEYKTFERPSGIVAVDICTESGKLAVPGLCDQDPRGSTIKREYFAKGTEPTEICDVHFKATICTESGLLASEYCPDYVKAEKVFIVRPTPLDPSNWNLSTTPRIEDRQYELPSSLQEEEYCTMHGIFDTLPGFPLYPDDWDDSSYDDDYNYYPGNGENSSNGNNNQNNNNTNGNDNNNNNNGNNNDSNNNNNNNNSNTPPAVDIGLPPDILPIQ
jgi:penicillin-binding protein 1A